MMYQLPEIPVKKRFTTAKPAYKKPDSVRELETLATAEAIRTHPAVDPKYIAPRVYSDKTANSLTAAIVAYITLRGGMASRISVTGTWDKKLNKYRTSTMKRGLADVWATYHGMSIQVEVKKGRDVQSDDQIKVQQQQEQSGGFYYVAHDFTSFKQWFDTIIT